MKDKICKKCGRVISYDTYFKRYICRQCGYEENPIDNKGWHVVAEGDLPKKIIDEYGFPVEYIVMIAGAEEPTTAVMDEDGEWYDVAFEYYNIPESEKDYFNVVAWRELPEPWEERMK